MVLYVWIVLQVILESVPVSSSGHVALMQLYADYFGFQFPLHNDVWVVDFLLHGPMILILLFFFFATWWKMILKKSISLQNLFERSSWNLIFKTILFVLVADGITVVYWWLDINPHISLRTGFCITAVLLFLTRYVKESKNQFDQNIFYAIILGVAQSISFLPGISRFASTFAVGRFCGYSGKISFAVSFLIQFPLLIAAFLKGLLALSKCPELLIQFWSLKIMVLVLISTLISYVLLRLIDDIIQKNRLWLFAWYMLIPIMLTFFV